MRLAQGHLIPFTRKRSPTPGRFLARVVRLIWIYFTPSQDPIIPIMLYDAKLSQDFANALMEEGIYVIGFFYPVVPKGKARIRVQISAGHDRELLERAVAGFTKVGKKLGVI
jgi:glycine C-acetyltransferase